MINIDNQVTGCAVIRLFYSASYVDITFGKNIKVSFPLPYV